MSSSRTASETSSRSSRSQSTTPAAQRYSLSAVDWSQSSRRSLDMAQPRRTRNDSAGDVFSHAFSAEPDQDDGLNAHRRVDMFPASVYRSSSRTSSLAPSSRSTSIYSLTPTPSAGAGSPSDAAYYRPGEMYSASPVISPLTATDRGYSPMAAGFARLKHNDPSPSSIFSPSPGKTTGSGKEPASELGARLFAGPA